MLETIDRLFLLAEFPWSRYISFELFRLVVGISPDELQKSRKIVQVVSFNQTY